MLIQTHNQNLVGRFLNFASYTVCVISLLAYSKTMQQISGYFMLVKP